MLNKPTIVFLGGGNMAEAIFANLCQQNNFKLEIIQRNPQKALRISQRYNLKVSQLLKHQLSANDILILAVKPQQAKEACLAIREFAGECLIVSLMAGVTIASIQSWLNNPKIIRSMPNTPAAVGMGVTALYFPPSITGQSRILIESVFKSMGITWQVDQEDDINKALPISSSAIAFVYYFMEGMINTAVNQFGLNQEQAKQIITQVLSGSLAVLASNPESTISQQRALVTSQKGTTAQGILTLETGNFHQLISHAMQSCYQRGLELAREFN